MALVRQHDAKYFLWLQDLLLLVYYEEDRQTINTVIKCILDKVTLIYSICMQ